MLSLLGPHFLAGPPFCSETEIVLVDRNYKGQDRTAMEILRGGTEMETDYINKGLFDTEFVHKYGYQL